tara:strand:+ start:312 stop:1331 length:1020 start_codon:yes stop_codon:yes gene_type:complete
LAKIDIYPFLLGSIFFDFLVGDPTFLLHPVQIIGFWIDKFSKKFLRYFKDKHSQYLGGLILLITTIAFSYFSGKYIEYKFIQSGGSVFWGIILLFGISSCLASKSLIKSVQEISDLLLDISIDDRTNQNVINKVQRLVSRDVSSCSKEDLLRSAIESLTENSVDGIFGPLFWIFIGAFCLNYSIYLPGPLSLGFSYKALSTLDSMVGYKYEPFQYIGFFSAKLEDYATYLPCRVVVYTLPLVTKKISKYFYLIQKTFSEGRKYESPNSGISQAIFAHIANIKLGGENKYQEKIILKPLLNSDGSKCNKNSINLICNLIIRLEILWLVVFSLFFYKLINS